MLGIDLDQVAQVLSGLESRSIRMNSRQCTKSRHRLSKCTLCADHCPRQAIVWGEALEVDKTKCNGCGVCTAVCPAGAFEAANPTSAELLERVKNKPHITFACSKAGQSSEDSLVRVSCLGRIDDSILIGAVSLGAQTVELIDGVCAACPDAMGRTVVGKTVEKANVLLQAFGHEERITFRAELPEQRITSRPAAVNPVSRRGFFNLLARETAGAIAITVGTVVNQEIARPESQPRQVGQLPKYVPVKQKILLDAVKRLNLPQDSGPKTASGPWATFTTLPECNVCQMCAFFCPTGALEKTNEDGRPGLAFRVALCTNCRLCLDICYRHAVNLSPEADLGHVVAETTQKLVFDPQQYADTFASPEEKIKRLLGLSK